MKAIFINKQDLVDGTILDGSIDADKIMQYVAIAQDVHIQNFLGTKLYNKIQDDVLNDNLQGDYLLLVKTYIKPMLVHYTMMEYLPFSNYQIANGGVFKHNSENSRGAEREDIDYLIGKERNLANYYTNRLIDYLCFESSKFPEYRQNNNDDIRPDRDTNSSVWVL